MLKELSVGEVARRSGVAVSTVHFYESRGLIVSRRTGGNQRRYGRDVLGASPSSASRRRSAYRSPTLPRRSIPCRRAARRRATTGRCLSSAWRDDLDRRIEQLTKLRDGLTDCIGCGCMSIDKCPLRNPDDRLARQGPGARRLMTPRN